MSIRTAYLLGVVSGGLLLVGLVAGAAGWAADCWGEVTGR